MAQPFDLHQPGRLTTALIFASPHSGNRYPGAFLRRSALSAHQLRSSEDAFVDRLFDAAPAGGAPFLVARHPRAWIDLNRAEGELDPALIEGLRPGRHNPRVASGLGVVPRVVAGGRAIYHGKIPLSDARTRIREVWRPWHDALTALVDRAQATYGEAILIDCHSMPHEALEGCDLRGARPNVVLGDRYGASASREVVDRIEALFVAEGLTVSRNMPFAGAYTAQKYGRPAQGRHVVQVEIDRALYMDEESITPHAGFDVLKRALDRIVAGLCDIGRPEARPVAAE